MDNTIIQQGMFLSTGASVSLTLRSDVDWMKVINWTQSKANIINTGVEFYWQRGMPVNDGLCYYHVAADHTLSSDSIADLVGAGFTLYNTFDNPYGNNNAITRIEANGTVLTPNTVGLSNGSVVRFNNVINGLQHCNGMLYSIFNLVPGVSFDIAPAGNNVDTGVTTGNYQIVYYPPNFQPANIYITNVSNDINAIVVTSIPNGFEIGQEIRFKIPKVSNVAYGMLQLDGMVGTVLTIIDDFTFTIDIDTTAFGAFAFPLTGDVAFTYAQAIPFGENTATALAAVPQANILGDAVRNIGQIGIELGAGAYGPAGQIVNGVPDTIFWVAGKSFNI